jgi:hypothetical protein
VAYRLLEATPQSVVIRYKIKNTNLAPRFRRGYDPRGEIRMDHERDGFGIVEDEFELGGRV